MIKLLIFDWNGLLINDARLVYRAGTMRICQAYGLGHCPSFDKYRRNFHLPWVEYYRKLLGRPEVTEEELNAILYAGIEEMGPAELFADARTILDSAIDSGLRVTIASGMSEWILFEALSGFGISGRFEIVTGGLNDKSGAFREHIEKTGVTPQETLCLGDTVHDAESALAVGASACLVPRGFHHPDRLHEFASSHDGVTVVGSLTEAWKIIRAMT